MKRTATRGRTRISSLPSPKLSPLFALVALLALALTVGFSNAAQAAEPAETTAPATTEPATPQAGTHVTYKFTNPRVPGVDYADTLPEEVTSLLPTDDATYADGDTISPKALVPAGQTTTDASVHYVRVTNTDAQGKEHKGIWTFKGWDQKSVTADGATDVTFTGTWQYGEEEWSGHLLKLDEDGKLVEGTPDGTVPFAFVDSRYYDGTSSANPFNLGFKMGNGNPYWTNGDWYHPDVVYRSDDYFYDATGAYREDYADFNQNGQVNEEKPKGYPLNDVGASATGTLVTAETDESGNAKPDTAKPSPNAGTYTWVQWSGDTIAPFGRSVVNNYDFSGLAGQTATWPTYTQVYKVNPIVSLTLDKTNETVHRGDTVTATFTIENTYDNMEGLPTADQVSFAATYDTAAAGADAGVNAAADTNVLQPSSEVQKNGNVYTQSFVVTEDANATSITITATTSSSATNYNEGSASQTLNLPATHGVAYRFVAADGSDLPSEVTSLLPEDSARYEDGAEVSAKAPSRIEVKDADGNTWAFEGWDAESKTVAGEDLVFTGTWEREAEPEPKPEPSTPETPVTPEPEPSTPEPEPEPEPTTPEPSTPEPSHDESSNKELPQTSDTANFGAILAVVVIGLLAAVGGVLLKRARKPRE